MIVDNCCQLLEAVDVLPRLRQDIQHATQINVWCYTVEPAFFKATFLDQTSARTINILVDYKQRNRLLELQTADPRLQVRCWQRNRTQHDKTILTLNPNTVWFTTSNLHRGSFMLANNRSMRVTSRLVHTRLYDLFAHQWKISQPCEEPT